MFDYYKLIIVEDIYVIILILLLYFILCFSIKLIMVFFGLDIDRLLIYMYIVLEILE